MKVETVLLFAFVLIFLGFLYANRKSVEGFDGDVPTANQTSAFPRDTSAATTTDPKIALAQPKDVEALMEVIKNFQLLYNAQDPMTLNLDPQSLQQTQYFSMQADNLQNQLQAALASSDAVSISFDDTVQLRKAYECSIDILRGKSQTQDSMTSTAFTASNGLTLDILVNLRKRVQAESLQLSNLRSTAPTITARIAELDKLAANLGDIISSVQRGETKIGDVNITPEDANKFLNTLETGQNGPVPDVSVSNPVGGSTNSMSIGPTGFPAGDTIQSIMEIARNMKWSLSIGLESDPALKQSQEVLDKITAIETSMNKYMISGTPIPPNIQRLYEQQLAVLRNLTGDSRPDAMSILMGPPKPELRQRYNISEAHMPSQDDLNLVQGMSVGPFGTHGGPAAGSASNGIGSGDYAMSDDNIRHRGSAASFDDSMAGGLDYKTRALEMCRQIQAANLGDPTNFGCIKNPDEVSASYSWKGNYQMVCSRLGDTWGNWYPQMFGCPKVDPTAKFTRKT